MSTKKFVVILIGIGLILRIYLGKIDIFMMLSLINHEDDMSLPYLNLFSFVSKECMCVESG